MNEFKNVIQAMAKHGKILWKGLKRMVYGALTAGLYALAIYGLVMINRENGWTAVCEFIGAMATMGVAVICMYHQGGGKRRKGGFEK